MADEQHTPDSTGKRVEAERIVRTLRAHGHRAFFVGGCVRDLVRSVEPDDYDIATSATPDKVEKLFDHTIEVGRAFGVMLVVSGGANFEVATFRTEGGYSDGRHPDKVEFADERADVMRRDFTVNGMLFDPETNEVLDYVGSRADIEKKVIRTIGEPEERFHEDSLRMMRAVRFAAALGYAIEPATRRAILDNAESIRRISAERIRKELLRMLTAAGARRAVELLSELCLLKIILPEVEAMKGVQQPPEFHPEGDVFNHTMIMLEKMKKPAPDALALAVLLHDAGKPDTFRRAADRIRFDEHCRAGAETARKVCRRLKCDNELTSLVVSLVADHMRFREVQKMRPMKLKRFLRQEHFDYHLELHRLDCLASHGKLDNYDFCTRMLEELAEEELRPPKLLTGRDLIRMGYSPGPRFGEILRALEDAQLENHVASREEADAFVREHFPR